MRFFENIDFYGMKVEFIGTFAVVYFGGWAWMNYTFKNCSIMEVAFTHFLVYALFVWSGYMFSGALYNPAITTLMMIFKKISLPKGVFYLISQLLGCLLAASLLKLIAPDSQATKLKDNKFIGFIDMFGTGGTSKWIVLIIYEAIGSAFITIVYYMTIVSKRGKSNIQGLAVGAAYGSITASFGPLTGAAVNPAKVIGPGLVGRAYLPVLPYLIGDFGGVILGGLLCEFVLMKDSSGKNMLEDKGAAIPEKKNEQFINQIPEFKRKNSDDDYFDGTLNDLETLDHKNKQEMELRDKHGVKKYAYEDSDDGMDDMGDEYLNKATELNSRKFVGNIDEDNPLNDVKFELSEQGKAVDKLTKNKADKKRMQAPLSGVDGMDMPAPLVVTEADGTVGEEARVMPKGYKASDIGKAKQPEKIEEANEESDDSDDDVL